MFICHGNKFDERTFHKTVCYVDDNFVEFENG